jgi:hypothetical protein
MDIIEAIKILEQGQNEENFYKFKLAMKIAIQCMKIVNKMNMSNEQKIV